jgi:hypothetical protein
VDVDVVDMHVDGLDGVGAWGYNVQPTRSPAQCTAAGRYNLMTYKIEDVTDHVSACSAVLSGQRGMH